MTVCAPTQIRLRQPEKHTISDIEKPERHGFWLEKTQPKRHPNGMLRQHVGVRRRELFSGAMKNCLRVDQWSNDGSPVATTGGYKRPVVKPHGLLIMLLWLPFFNPACFKYHHFRRKCVRFTRPLWGWPFHRETTIFELWFAEVISLRITLPESCDHAKYWYPGSTFSIGDFLGELQRRISRGNFNLPYYVIQQLLEGTGVFWGSFLCGREGVVGVLFTIEPRPSLVVKRDRLGWSEWHKPRRRQSARWHCCGLSSSTPSRANVQTNMEYKHVLEVALAKQLLSNTCKKIQHHARTLRNKGGAECWQHELHESLQAAKFN